MTVGREIREMHESGLARENATSGLEAHDDMAVLRPVPDLRDTPVEDASGVLIGKLYGSVAEADTGLLRYIDLSLANLDRHILVPIGHARVREQEDRSSRIRLRTALLEELERIPPFPADAGHIDDPFERALLEAYGRTFHGERYYAHPAYDHSGIYNSEHLEVDDVANADSPLTRLSYLSGWRVAKGEPDIRGWPLVLSGDDSRVSIRDLVVDPGAGKVRYVVVELPDESARLLPIGFLRVNRSDETVVADGLISTDLNALPVYGGGGVTRDQEDRIVETLRRVMTGRRRYLLPDFRT